MMDCVDVNVKADTYMILVKCLDSIGSMNNVDPFMKSHANFQGHLTDHHS